MIIYAQRATPSCGAVWPSVGRNARVLLRLRRGARPLCTSAHRGRSAQTRISTNSMHSCTLHIDAGLSGLELVFWNGFGLLEWIWSRGTSIGLARLKLVLLDYNSLVGLPLVPTSRSHAHTARNHTHTARNHTPCHVVQWCAGISLTYVHWLESWPHTFCMVLHILT